MILSGWDMFEFLTTGQSVFSTEVGTRTRFAFLADEVTRHHCTQSCASRLHLQSYVSQKRRSNIVRKDSRLSTLRLAPKVTLKSNRQSQQQQSICEDVTCTRKFVHDRTEIRDVRGHTTDDQTSTRRLARDPEPGVEKKPRFEIDFRVEGVSQDASLLQHEEQMKEINEKVGKVFEWDQAQNPFVSISRKVL